jgi:hypothetical protein
MLKLVLLLLPGLAVCQAGPRAHDPVFIDGVENAPLLGCTERDATRTPGSPVAIAATGDTALAALFSDANTLMLFDTAFNVLRQLQFSREGPAGVLDAHAFAIIGDSIFIADAKGERIIVFDWHGKAHRTVRTDFAPLQIARHNDDVIVSAAVVGRFPGTLLFDIRGEKVSRRDVPVVDFPDLTTKALGNRVKLLIVGRNLVVLHQFFTPRALLIGNGSYSELRVPLPSAARKAVGYVPPLPLNDEALRPALVVANDAVVAKGEVLMLVRSGRSRGSGFEKAIMRTDSVLNFRAAYRLPVAGGLLAALSRNGTIVVVDEEDRWHTCKLPS